MVLALAGTCAFAQASATEPAAKEEIELTPVTVSAHDSLAVPYDQTGVSVSILNIPELKKEGIYSLTEALTTVPGVLVQPGGGDNQRGNISHTVIRGISSSTSILTMVDGMRIFNSGGGGNLTPNLVARTDLFSLGNVEVLKGAQGAVYGCGAQAGVLFMETPEGKGKPGFSLFHEAGSFDSYTGNATAQGQEGKLSYFVSATYTHTANDLRLSNGEKIEGKHAGKYDGWNEAVRLDWQANDTNKLTFTYRREDSEFHYGSAYSSMYGLSVYDFRSNLVSGKWQSKLTDKWTSSLMAGYFGYDANFGSGALEDVRNVQVEWRNAYRWNERHTTTGGFSWSRSQYDSKNSYYNSLDNLYSLFAEHRYSPTKTWDNSLALRWDESNLYDSKVTFRAASSYKFNQERTRAFASFGSGYRAPGSFQRSNASLTSWGTTWVGNPGLSCEKSLDADWGMEQKLAQNHYVSATLFWSQIKDAIAPEYLSDGRGSFRNEGHYTMQGVELSLHGTFEKEWNTGYQIGWTYTQPKTGQDKQIAWSARQVWSADIHTSPMEGLTTGIGLAAAVGRYGCWNAGVDNYYTLRWYAQYEVNEHLTFHVRVENLTDQKFITEDAGPDSSLINSGIGIFGGCTVKF